MILLGATWYETRNVCPKLLLLKAKPGILARFLSGNYPKKMESTQVDVSSNFDCLDCASISKTRAKQEKACILERGYYIYTLMVSFCLSQSMRENHVATKRV